MLGQILGHYQIKEQIGAGGMGVVYLAHDERLERDVALKVLPPGTLADEAARKRFRQEALTLSKLNHPNIAIIFDFDTENDIDFLVTEYVAGISLDTKVATSPLRSDEVVRLGIQLADGLAAAHAQGVVHRDLKPANLRLTSEGRLKILDFGLAELIEHETDVARTMSFTTSQQITGTLPYMAPEQLRGQPLDARSDIWAAGAVLYELATGSRPFVGANGPLLIDAILNRSPEPPSNLNRGITPGLEEIILKALEKDPARRYQSSRELEGDLERLTANVPLAAATGLRPSKWIAAGLVLLALILWASWLFLGHRKRQATPSGISARRSVAVLGFKNLSGRQDTEWLSTALSEMLTTELAAGEKLLTISGENVARVKTDLALPEEDTLASDTLSKVRENLGSDFVVLGSYLELGSKPNDPIRLDLRLQDAGAGQTIAVVSEKGTLAQLDDVVTRAGAQLRQKLGEGNVPTEEQPTVKASLPASLSASRLYAEGLARLRNYDALGARDLLLKAVAEEPTHVPSLVALSAAWGTLGYDSKSLEAARQAFELSANLPYTERLRVEGQYYEQSSQWDKAIAAYKALFQREPDNLDYGLKLTNAQIDTGKNADALATIARLRTLPAPHRDDLRIDLAESRAAHAVADFKRELVLAQGIVEKAQQQGARLLLVRARISQCNAYRQLGDGKGAVSACQDAQQIAAQAGDRLGVATAMNNAANALYDQGNYQDARKMYEAAVQAYRDMGNLQGLAGALDNIASIMDDQGDHVGARQLSEQALAIYRETGYLTGVGDTLNNIGTELTVQGDLAGAQKHFSESLDIWRQMGNASGAAISLTNLGDVRLQLADLPGSQSAYAEALAAFLKGGEKSKAAYPQVGLGDVLLAAGDLPGAKQSYEDGLASARAADDKHQSAFALEGLAQVALEEDDLQGARQHLEDALSLRKELGEKDAAAHTVVQLAGVSLEEGKFADAEAAARKSIPAGKADAGGEAALAHAALAQALLALGKIHEAQHESAISKKQSEQTQLRRLQLQVQLVTAEVEAAAGALTGAMRSLQDTQRQAEKLAVLRVELEAGLQLAQLELKTGETARARASLEALARKARDKGFLRIAKHAEQAVH